MIPIRVDTVVISTQHAEEISTADLRKEIREKIIDTVIPAHLLDDRTVYHIQPSGRFVIGGPQGDAGLTGRKIIVDTYGGWGAHGGGAFSGKDFSKVDRSAAYTARWIGTFRDTLFLRFNHTLTFPYHHSQVHRRRWPRPPCPRSALIRHRSC